MGMLVFFPWISIREILMLDQIELMPLNAVKGSFDEEVTKDILSNYFDSNKHCVKDATLIKFVGKGLTENLIDEELSYLWNWCEILAFSALSTREYFSNREYFNRDNFKLVVQAFPEKSNGTYLTSRRRDGHISRYWSNGSYKVIRPDHVSRFTLNINERLFHALIGTMNRQIWYLKYADALFSYNKANTDGDDVTEYSEVVYLVGAFERLYRLKSGREVDFANKINTTYKFQASDVKEIGRLKGDRFLSKGNSIRRIWSCDFYQYRNHSAHGNLRPKRKSRWNLKEHLLLSSYIFPLFLMIELQKNNAYKLNNDERERIFLFDRLLCAKDLFSPIGDEVDSEEFPWNKVMSEGSWDWISQLYV